MFHISEMFLKSQNWGLIPATMAQAIRPRARRAVRDAKAQHGAQECNARRAVQRTVQRTAQRRAGTEARSDGALGAADQLLEVINLKTSIGGS